MAALPRPLQGRVESPDPEKVYVYLSGGETKRSFVYDFAISNGEWLEPRHDTIINILEKARAQDLSKRLDPESAGFLTTEELAEAYRKANATSIARYLEDMILFINEIGVNAEEKFFETVKDAQWRWTRLRKQVEFVPPKQVVEHVKRGKSKKRSAKPRKAVR